MNDIDDFRRRVRQTDDYTKHRRAFVAALILGFLGIVVGGAAFGTFKAGIALGVGGAGASLLACGLYAIRGGKSDITSVTVGSKSRYWSNAELDRMSRRERAHHANLTGFLLIVLGLWFLGMAFTAVAH